MSRTRMPSVMQITRSRSASPASSIAAVAATRYPCCVNSSRRIRPQRCRCKRGFIPDSAQSTVMTRERQKCCPGLPQRGACAPPLAIRGFSTKLSLHIGLSAQFAQAFRDARLPTRTRSFPTLNDVNGKPDGNELTRIRRARTSTFVHDGAHQRLVGELRQILIFMSTNDVRIDLRKVRLQSTARGGLSHGC